MVRYEWTSDLETGHPDIDAQHSRLFDLAGMLSSAVEGLDCGDGPVDDAIYALSEYCSEHFADEERLMEEASYPDLGAHREMHRILVARTMAMTARYFNGEEVAPAEVAPFVADWLRGHIEAADGRFVDYLRRHRGDGADPSQFTGTVT